MHWLGFATRLVLVNVLFVAGTLAGLVHVRAVPGRSGSHHHPAAALRGRR